MSTKITIENKLTGFSKKLAIRYRKELLEQFSKHIDNIRKVADEEFIIPRTPLADRERRQYQLWRMQKTHPTKLTHRTGALHKMLTIKGKWSKGSRRYLYRSPAVQATVKVTSKGTQVEETYTGTITADVRDPTAISRKQSAQQLFFRFRWDLSRGIRGRRRPFITPAAYKENINFRDLIAQKFRDLNNLGAL